MSPSFHLSHIHPKTQNGKWMLSIITYAKILSLRGEGVCNLFAVYINIKATFGTRSQMLSIIKEFFLSRKYFSYIWLYLTTFLFKFSQEAFNGWNNLTRAIQLLFSLPLVSPQNWFIIQLLFQNQLIIFTRRYHFRNFHSSRWKTI